jgi:sorting nexin-4
MQDPQDFEDGRLECTVSLPQKENEGTKDAYISYLVITKVITALFLARPQHMLISG